MGTSAISKGKLRIVCSRPPIALLPANVRTAFRKAFAFIAVGGLLVRSGSHLATLPSCGDGAVGCLGGPGVGAPVFLLIFLPSFVGG